MYAEGKQSPRLLRKHQSGEDICINSNSFVRQTKSVVSTYKIRIYDNIYCWVGTEGISQQSIKVKYYLGKAEGQEQAGLKHHKQTR